jgi:hypothetical protein
LGWVSIHVRRRVDYEKILRDRPAEDRARRSENLIGQDRCRYAGHRCAHVGAADVLGRELCPPRQEMAAHEAVGLLPRFISLLAVKLDVFLGQLSEGPCLTLGPPLGDGVLTAGRLQHDLGREAAGVG